MKCFIPFCSADDSMYTFYGSVCRVCAIYSSHVVINGDNSWHGQRDTPRMQWVKANAHEIYVQAYLEHPDV